jgi:hypothetical protein
MFDETNACCMCGTTKFVGRVNTGEKYYCNSCMKKINDSGMDYWKSCSNTEFFDSMLSHMKNRETNTENWSGLKKQLREIKEAKKSDGFDYDQGFDINEVYDQE